MIRKATLEDLDYIMKIVEETIQEMNSYNNFQWDNNYPKKENFISDVEKGDLYIVEENGEVAGFACINKEQPEEYECSKWSKQGQAFVVHRLAVSLTFRKCGIAYKLMEQAEKLTKEFGFNYLRTDTNSKNKGAQRLFDRCGYKFVGEIELTGKEGPFYCYDKIIK